MKTVTTDQLLTFFKVMADGSRLKIVGLLAQQPRSVEELAALLGLGAPTVSHHLGKLQKAGLVQAQAQQYYSVYSLNQSALQDMAAHMLKPETMMNAVNEKKDIDPEAFEKSVIAKALKDGVDGRVGFPTGLMRMRIVLRWLGRNKFELGKRYTETQVEDILERSMVGPDTNHVRRYMVDEKVLARKPDGSFYWRADTPVRQSATAVGLDPDVLPLSDHKLASSFVARRNIQQTYFRGGRYTVPDTVDADTLKSVLDVVWSLLRLRFDKDKPYTAAQVDAIIARLCHGDTERIRNLLVEHEYLLYRKRADRYLRTDEGEANPEDVLTQFVTDDRLTALPDAPEQRRVVLRWLAGKLQLRKRYDRDEVDAVIEVHKPDGIAVAELRNAILKERMLDHKGTTFWRVA